MVRAGACPRAFSTKPCAKARPCSGGCGAHATLSADRVERPTARFWCWPIRWPRRGREKRVAGRLGALLGLWCWRAMLASAGNGAACLFSLYIRTALALHTARPRRSNRLNLMLWPRLWHGLAYGLGLCCSRVTMLSPRRIVARAINPAGYRLAMIEATSKHRQWA